MNRILAVSACLIASLALAQNVPGSITFNARLADTAGAPVSGAHSLVFGLYATATGGAAVWTENVSGVSFSAEGVAFVELGAVTALTPSALDGTKLYLEVSVDGTTMSPRLGIVSVPYAIRATVAATAGSVGSLTESAIQRRVTGMCSPGQAVRSIDVAGGVQCEPVGIGDITAVTTATGSGLTGGSLTGDVALGLAACATDQVLVSTGSGWACSTPSPGGAGAPFASDAGLAATTLASALDELSRTRASLTEMPISPNFIQDSRFFNGLGSTTTPAAYTAASAATVRSPWGWNVGAGASFTLELRKIYSNTYIQSGDPELGPVGALTTFVPAVPGYTDFNILVLRATIGSTGPVTYAGYMRQGCVRFGGAYSQQQTPTSMTALIKVIQVGTNHVINIGANGWPRTSWTAATGNWRLANANNPTTGGCLDPITFDCTGACSGTSVIAIALPHIGLGHRTNFAWAGYAPWLDDDQPRTYGGQAGFAFNSCGDTVGAPCVVDLTPAGFTAPPSCTLTPNNVDATGYREQMVIRNATTTTLNIWRGQYGGASGTTMVVNYTCTGR